MASQGPYNPGTVSTVVLGNELSWINLNNCKTENGVYTIIDGNYLYTIDGSDYLVVSNFGFTIPSGATIDGIKCEIKRYNTNSEAPTEMARDLELFIVKANGSYGTTNKADTANNWPTTNTYKTYGGTTDKWGETWAYSDINDADFGVALRINIPNAEYGFAEPFVDHFKITVYYTESSGGAYTLTTSVTDWGVAGQNLTALKATRSLPASVTAWSIAAVNLSSLKAARKVITSAASFTAAGVDTTLKTTRLLTTSVTDNPIAGQDTGLKATRLLTSQVTDLAITGQDLTLKATRLLTTESAAASVTTYEATLTYTEGAGDVILTTESIDIGISAQDVILKATRRAITEAIDYTISGQSADLKADRLLNTSVTSSTITGIDINTYFNRKILTESTDFAVTGSDSLLAFARKLQTGAVSYVISGDVLLRIQYLPTEFIRVDSNVEISLDELSRITKELSYNIEIEDSLACNSAVTIEKALQSEVTILYSNVKNIF